MRKSEGEAIEDYFKRSLYKVNVNLAENVVTHEAVVKKDPFIEGWESIRGKEDSVELKGKNRKKTR